MTRAWSRGCTNAAKLLEDIPNKVRDILGIMVEVNLREEAGKEYLEIVVEPYPYPVSYKGEYHYRSGSTKQELKGAALDRFLLRKQGRHWDGVPMPHFTVADLSPQALATFRKRAAKSKRLSAELLAEPDAVLLDKLKLFEHGYLKRAAVMLFHDDPERVVTGAYVKIGYFRTDSDLLYHDEIHGDLFSQVEKRLWTCCLPSTCAPASPTKASSASKLSRCPSRRCARPSSTPSLTRTTPPPSPSRSASITTNS